MANSASTARKTGTFSHSAPAWHYVLPVPGEFYVFPAWQPHSVMPFRGDGERWSLTFNVVAAPGVAPTAMQQHAPQQQPLGNVSLSSQRPTDKGF